VVGTLIRMKLATLRHTPGAVWGWKGYVGLLLAVGTASFGLLGGDDPSATADLLALAFAGWTIGWILAPIQSGGGDERLVPEHFSLLPISPPRLATGLLAVSLVGVGPLVSLVAMTGLVLLGLRLGVGPALIALPALLLQLTFVALLSRVAIGATSSALKSRVGLEFVALQYALLIALSAVGWVLLAPLGEAGGSERSGGLWREGPPSPVATIVRVLPSGWAPVAIEAAGASNWPLAAGALLGLAALVSLLLLAWGTLLRRRLTTRGRSATSHAGLTLLAPEGRLLPATPLGAVIGRELRGWLREPRSAIALRIAILSGWLIVLIPLVAGWPDLLPWAGPTIAVMAGVTACNAYGLEGSTLWLTLTIPWAERVDVRGKQLAFFLVFGPVAVASTVAFTALSEQDRVWPWVLAATPALLGGAAGLMALVSVTGAAPVPEVARRSGNLLAAADNTGQAFLMLFAVPLTTLPATAVVLAGVLLDSALLRWAGVPVGIATGLALAWWLGQLAVRKLESGGPELLQLLRHGPPVKEAAATGRTGRAGDVPPGLPGKIVLAC
jgi:ABC-2 type transport system permease protein